MPEPGRSAGRGEARSNGIGIWRAPTTTPRSYLARFAAANVGHCECCGAAGIRSRDRLATARL